MTIVRDRERRTEFMSTYSGRNQFWANGVKYDDVPTSLNLWNMGYQSDGVHPVEYLGTPRGRLMDIGGGLFSLQARMDFPSGGNIVASSPYDGPGLSWYYKGDVIASPSYAPTGWNPSGVWSTWFDTVDDFATRLGYGATAIARCKPASPEASFGQFLAELYRDGVPRLLSNFKVQDEVSKFRSLGSNYLNVEFGWKPFVSDLKNTARALENQTQILEDLQRNSGKAMRRSYSFPTQSVVDIMAQDNERPWPNLNAYAMSQTGGRVVTRTSTKKTWFRGEFIYYFPAVDAGHLTRLRAYSRQILGLDLTPETLWNIAPWSWLSDWVANVGDVLANISAISEDNLTMRYGYLMQEAKRVYEHTHSGLSTPHGFISPTITGKAVYTAKTRIGASPFGFGLTESGFSPRQIAILGAIGLTRRPPKQ